MKNHQNKQIIVWGLHEFQNYRDDVDYRLCKNEDDLLIKFLDTWSMMYPDVITGWNTEFFDIPYICNRIKNLFGEDFVNKLSKKLGTMCLIEKFIRWDAGTKCTIYRVCPH